MNSKSRLAKLFALSLAILAVAIPAVASASPVGTTLGEYHAPADQSSTAGYASPNATLGSDGAATPAVSSAPRVVSASDPGFDWGDAAVGASIALAVMVIGAGSLLVARELRADRTRFRVTG